MTSLDKKKLKLIYFNWQRNALYQDDSISVSGFFANNEIKICEEFKLQILNRLDLEIGKLEIEISKMELRNTGG